MALLIFILLLLLQFCLKHARKNYLLWPDLEAQFRKPIEAEFTYYQKLSAKNKVIFRKRLQKFIYQKEFKACGDLDYVTPRMKALIGASAIQLTFGLHGVYLEHFDRIFIYPDAYRSIHSNGMHKGEVNMKGAIVLSWNNFLEGYEIEDDGINLGLHEMAHALKIEDMVRNGEYDFFEGVDMRRFIGQTRREAIRINNGEKSLFRPYAATNDHEFFAVVVENFFERPALLKQLHKEIYYLTARLLRQDVLILHRVSVK